MKQLTFIQVTKMKGLIIQFLSIANNIEEGEWVEIIKSIQGDKARLEKIQFGVELGNVFIMLFFLNEILESILSEESSSSVH